MGDTNRFIIPEDLTKKYKDLSNAVDHIQIFLTASKGLNEETKTALGSDETSEDAQKQREEVHKGIDGLTESLGKLVDMTSEKGQQIGKQVADAEQQNVDMVQALGLKPYTSS